ncbi:MAG: glucosidase [Verrucomicrobia bacterium]|nr:glucosidase [Verrucomicrobiota bacterium]
MKNNGGANPERRRLAEANAGRENWLLWGPYLSERQWGTVREDYSPGGTAWDHFPHDHARSRAYRWGEDGIAGLSDDWQRLCLSLALWNGRDPILKERLFGLTNGEGNHGEDVKELYYYLDATPTHSYLKMLYKYPQRGFPYARLVEENRRRGKDQPEFELLDTGIFDDDRYFDVFVEYAKASADDILMLVTVHNRGPEAATIHLLPQLWFRNTWSWKHGAAKPELSVTHDGAIAAKHAELGEYRLCCDNRPELLFCNNETNGHRLFGQNGAQGYFKDAFHDYVVAGNNTAVNPQQIGTKAAVHYVLTVPVDGSASVRLRLVAPTSKSAVSRASSLPSVEANRTSLSDLAAGRLEIGDTAGWKPVLPAFADFDAILAQRRREANEFYAELQKDIADSDARLVQRQAFAGMIWSKQFFYYDVPKWLRGDPTEPAPPPERKHGRNHEWTHLNNADIISMPDKWEYPWYAAWDLAFHCIPLALVDAEFAKSQLVLLTREWYMHPNGQLPAYEWAFGDVNPPVHAWATWRVFQMDRRQRRATNPEDPGDLAFLERVFHKLMLNFTWWVNRKDTQGRNIFQGGFLGLDNIGVFDRSAPLPTGGFINQADGTSWMAMYCLNLMRIALELARHNQVYQDIATKFFEHFLHIVEAMNNIGDEGIGLWDDQDAFYYDVLNTPNGQSVPLKVRSMVGLTPLFAVEVLDCSILKEVPEFAERLEWFLNYRPDLARLVSRWHEPGIGERRLLSLLRGHRMKCLLRRLLDETEFLSDFGVRALSRQHLENPYQFHVNGGTMEVTYQPAESNSGLFGGNSNWRGPIWMPVNYLIIESLQKFHHYYGDDFKVECPTGSGHFMTINEVACELSRRLTRLFLKDESGQRPVLKYHPKLATDPHFRDYVLFHEYFHGDSGRGVGASHQTGWTGLIAKLLQPRREQMKAPAMPRATRRGGDRSLPQRREHEAETRSAGDAMLLEH